MEYKSTFRNRLIYVFRLPYEDHEGCLKIGETTAPDDITLAPNSHELNAAARQRIAEYTRTAGIRYELLHTELTLYAHMGYFKSFNDKQVHSILERSGVSKAVFDIDGTADEWFCCDLETIRKAIAAAKRGESSLSPGQVSHHRVPVTFRPEQLKAIERTKFVLKKSGAMLWNAKMRMGKTLTSLQVVKEMKFHRTIIVTHRPVVDVGWFEDFGKIFYETDTMWLYGSRDKGEQSISQLEQSGMHYVYFASLQDLRGSTRVGGSFDKHGDIFETPWDLIIIDEAHEGTQTALGKAVQEALTHTGTKILSLSGTPFNLLENYTSQEVFTWDYVMEQKAKDEWSQKYPLTHNPYEELPKMNIFTFDLGELHQQFQDKDMAFNFREFFRTDGNGLFAHQAEVRRFLDLISSQGETHYPYSTESLREQFHHTFWIVPGVKEGVALMNMLREHPVFGNYKIVNVAGDEDEESIYSNDALNEVLTAIGPHPEETYTITLSCGKLTTGVTVKPWTAVLYLAGSVNTRAQSYMQTIFRVQSPATIGGRMKTDCYVFDFAPDRTLKMIAETARVNARAGATEESERKALGDFLNFCPIISCVGTHMEEYNVDQMMQQLKRVYVDKVVNSGFEDDHLYSRHLYNLSDEEVALLNELHGIISKTKASHKSDGVEINKQGFDQEEIDKVKREAKQKEKKKLTDEEAVALLEKRLHRQQRDAAVSILRGISIRMPLLIYGATLANEEEILTLDRFVELVDDRSWEEFMPRGVDKARFELYKRYYDEDIFAASGRQIRSFALAADRLPVTERVQQIAEIFNTFRNPDKETVLTPWRVVNMHMADTIGGWCFYDEQYGRIPLTEPRLVDRGDVTKQIFHNPDVRVLEINSKSGLYPLYVAYSLFRSRLAEHPDVDEHELWSEVVGRNLFVICKTEMARSITRRTLRGFTNAKINTHVYDDLLNQITNRRTEFITKLLSGGIFPQIHKNMKFDAIVGNPPYQRNTASATATTNAAYSVSVYHNFIDLGISLQPRYISLITPSRWMTKAGQSIPNQWVDKMIDCNHFRTIHDYPDASDCFDNVEIKGGVNYFLYETEYTGRCRYVVHKGVSRTEKIDYLNGAGLGVIIRDDNSQSILDKVIGIEGRYFDGYSFANLVGVRDYFTTPKHLTSNWQGYVLQKDKQHHIKYYLNKRLVPNGFAWIKEEDIPKGHQAIPLHKVFLPKAGGTGNDPMVIGRPFYGEPYSVSADTYMVVGVNDVNSPFTKEQCENIISYMKTRFFRYLVSIRKKTQLNSREVFLFVPLQDFDKPWTDEELYRKYNLTSEEIDCIEKTIKPME